MRRIHRFRRAWRGPLFAAALLSAAAHPIVAATSWGPLDSATRRITAQVGNKTLVVSLPFANFVGALTHSCAGSARSYRCTVTGGVSFSYELSVTPDGDSLFVDIESTDRGFEFVRPARVVTTGSWGRVDVGQYGLAVGQVIEKAGYCRSCQLWASAYWDPNVSRGTLWEQAGKEGGYKANAGSGDMKIAQSVLYEPNLDGSRQPVRERLEIRVGESLWQAVPRHPNQPSAFAQDLAETVFVDVWSHNQAIDLSHLLRVLGRIAGAGSKFFTNWASWGAGGHDGLTPDSIWLEHEPPYPPNTAGFGSLAKMGSFADLATALGFASFRTYYSQIEPASPSFLDGLVRRRVGSTGQELNTSKLEDLPALAARQESEIASVFATNAGFSDTVGGAFPSSNRDYDPRILDGLSMGSSTGHLKALADAMKTAYGGPVAGESLQFSHQLGEWVATGQFDLWNGHGRLMTPEYKLRRLHSLSTFHGLGLSYRFSDINEHWNADNWRLEEHQDDYRATEVLFGNGAYLYVTDQLDTAPWRYYLTEVLLIGQLQRHYALKEVASIEYHLGGSYAGGTWKTLESLVVEDGFEMVIDPGWQFKGTEPTVPSAQSREFERIRVRYADGFTVMVNRGESDFPIAAGGVRPIVLPPGGWAAWSDDLEVLAYSGREAATAQRVDFFEDRRAGVSYVDPRGGLFETPDGRRTDRITQWRWRGGTWEVRLLADLASTVPTIRLDGQRFPLLPTQRAAADSAATDFSLGLAGWRTLRGILTATELADGVLLDVHSPDPALISAPLAIDGESVETVSLRVHFEEPPSSGSTASLFFKRQGDSTYGSERHVPAAVAAQRGWQIVTFPVGESPSWRRSTIIQLRIDPLNGVSNLPQAIKLGHILEGPSS